MLNERVVGVHIILTQSVRVRSVLSIRTLRVLLSIELIIEELLVLGEVKVVSQVPRHKPLREQSDAN